MPRLKAPSNLPELVKSTFTRARSEGDLHYFPTQVTVLNVDSIPVSLSLVLSSRYLHIHTDTVLTSLSSNYASLRL
jgi:hypothetical protein